MRRTVFWTPVEGVGLEGLWLVRDDAGIAAESVVLGVADGEPFRIYYEIDCDRRWRPTRVHVATLGRTSQSAELRADGDGTWIDGCGEEIPALAGAIDVDVSATPFTNTLPIERLDLDAGESVELSVAYVDVPALSVETDAQRYTCIEPVGDDGGRFRYDATDGDFSAELTVDSDGLVVEYEGLFTRIEPP